MDLHALALFVAAWPLLPAPLAAQSARSAPTPATSAADARILAPVHELLPSQPWDLHEVDVTAVAAGDLDEDGDLDAALGLCELGDWGNSPERNALLLNQGGGRFRDATLLLPDEPDIPFDIGVADVDGDGDQDLLLTNDNVYSMGPGLDHLYRNQGHGRFVDASAQLPPDSDRGLVRFGDVDGDGDADVLFPSTASHLPELLLNDGAGAFSPSSAIPGSPDRSNGFFGDVDGDGDLDVLFSRSQRSALWLNDGSGGFSDASAGRVPTTTGTYVFDLGDIDGDLDLDLAGLGFALRNDGSGTFATTPVPGLSSWDVALRDVDGDGDRDLFGPTGLALNNGSGVFVNASGHLPAQSGDAFSFEPGDFDGDGDEDGLVAEYGEYLGTLAQRADFLLLNNGQSWFTDSRALDEFPASAFGPCALGRLDGDPFSDLVLEEGGQLRLRPGDGTGRFASPVPLASPGPSLYALHRADIDADGALDLASASDSGVRLYFGPGLAQSSTPVTTETYETVPGDFDGDGDLDLATSEVGPRYNRLLIDEGNRTFSLAPTSAFPKLPGSPSAIATLDAESDGDLDVVFAVFAPSAVRLYRNSGSATFTDVGGAAPTGEASGVAAGDVDGDGSPDLLTGSSGDQRLLQNDGTGLFTARPDLLPALPAAPRGHTLLDLDLDGDLDAINGYYGFVLRNDGTGHFKADGRIGFAESLAVDDMDGDGDLDVLNGGNEYGEPSPGPIYRNLTRQVTWLHLPSIGENLVLEVAGPPWEPFTLLTAPLRGQQQTPAGTLWLDPASTTTAAQGVLGALGRKQLSFLVPNTPALIGVTHYWQAFVGIHARTTNLEATTFTNL